MYRYELKFVLDEASHTRALSWLHMDVGAYVSYPQRHVNSVYFDDPGYSSVRDNLAGISNRKKMRLRWYNENHSPENVSGAALEIKYRDGRLGKKDKFDLTGIEKEILHTKFRDLFWKVENSMDRNSGFLATNHFSPTLHVSYERKYFERSDGMRITIDRNIIFYGTLPHTKPFENMAVPYPNTVMEIKFAPDRKNSVASALRRLNMTPKRHSKYLTGLAAFGYALYL